MRNSWLLLIFLPCAAQLPWAAQAAAPGLGRADFNRLAAAAGIPLFWRTDTANPGQLDPDELVVLGADVKGNKYVKDGKLTAEVGKATAALVELRRREAVRRELDQGRPTLVETDLSEAPEEDRAVMRHLAEAAVLIDGLYQTQIGTAGMAARVLADDAASRQLIARNQGPTCEAPLTQGDPFCHALPDFAEARSFAWPADATVDEAFCKAIAAEPNAKALMDPFTVVRRAGKGFVAVPYTEVYAKPMKAIAKTLRAAAGALQSEGEAAFKAYLLAAAAGFETNEWGPVDEAWAAMSADNSRWYLRVGPDETYFDPCQVKAGFHMSLARIDRTALEWQRRLTALRGDMEKVLAALIGPPYAARDVKFKLPEFINVVVNAGDSRSGLGATIGQSLPNFGKVAEESRGRTVAMVNLYTDADSIADLKSRDRSLFGEATVAYATGDPNVARLDTVLHEATHNLGPYGSTQVGGKLPEEVFGGRLDAILEELKSQTGALFYLPFLKSKGMLTEEEVRQGYASAISWAFGHVSRGMFTAEGQPKTYSQLSAIQLGELMLADAIRFVETKGDDPGRFEIVFERMPAAVEVLMREVGRIKATGDVKAAEALVEKHVHAEGLARIHADLITERVLRYPKASFVYAVRYGR